MSRINVNYIYKVLCLLCMMCFHSSVWGQMEVTYASAANLNKERLSLRQRLDFRTNAVDWGLTIPNFSVEFILPSVYRFSEPPGDHPNVKQKRDSLAFIATTRSKRTVGLSFKWNWNTSHQVMPPQVFNVFDVRVEWRQYFRTRLKDSRNLTKNPDLRTRLKERVFTTERLNPRMNRAYYWGIYAHRTGYSFKFGKEGRLGTAYGAGLSLGYTVPLYGYKTGYLDFELGGSVGLLYNSYDVYTHDSESNVYTFNPAKSKSGIVPFPVITDVRVAFVYRFMSASSKFQPSASRRFQRKSAKQNAINQAFETKKQEIRDAVAAMRKQGGNNVDSLLTKEQLKIWNQMQKEEKAEAEKAGLEELRRQAAASLGIVITDTLSKKDDKAIRQKMEEMEKAKKEEAKAAKEAEKAAEKEAELQKDPEKAKKQAEKEAEKAEKEAEKAKKKAEKEAEKAAKKEKKEKKSKKNKDGDKPDDEAVEPEKKEGEP